MSLVNVLLIHVSTMFLPQNEAAERKERDHEYYALLEIPKYSALPEIRKAHRRVTLRLQCDRMMLEWNAPSSPAAGASAGTTEDATTATAAATATATTTSRSNSNNQDREDEAAAAASRKRHEKQYQKATAALNAKETRIKEAFRVLGDRHLRQQYHLLQCRPSRYRIIRGPLAAIHGLTHYRKWFLVLQAVIVYVLGCCCVVELFLSPFILSYSFSC